jgi:hypothetical protein
MLVAYVAQSMQASLISIAFRQHSTNLRGDGQFVDLESVGTQALSCVHLFVAFWTFEVFVFLVDDEIRFTVKDPITVIAKRWSLFFDLFLLLPHSAFYALDSSML